jgi:ketosteroid isomerase-like protein
MFKPIIITFTSVALLGLSACVKPQDDPAANTVSFNAAQEKTAILKVIKDQKTAWNACDIDGFMRGYWQSPDLRFASGGNITLGWQATLDNYKKRYQDCEQMGTLDFTQLDVRVFSEDAAQVFGHWGLVRAGDHPHGLFTLTFRKFGEDWRIIADHTSAASPD